MALLLVFYTAYPCFKPESSSMPDEIPPLHPDIKTAYRQVIHNLEQRSEALLAAQRETSDTLNKLLAQYNAIFPDVADEPPF